MKRQKLLVFAFAIVFIMTTLFSACSEASLPSFSQSDYTAPEPNISATPSQYSNAMPEDAVLILLTDMGYDDAQKRYYISGKAGGVSEEGIAEAIGSDIYHFLIVEDDGFYAYAWEPGITGATGHQTYHNASNFESLWFRAARRAGYEDTAFWISFNESGQVESLNEFYSNYGFHGYDDDYEEDPLARIDIIIDEAIAIMDAVRQDNLSHVTFGFEKRLVYDFLIPEDKAMYDEMIDWVRDFEPFEYTALEHGYEELDRSLRVFGAIGIDYPQLDSYFKLHEVLDGNMTAAMESLYFMPWDPEQEPADIDALRVEMELFDAVCDRIIERMPESLSAFDKYRYLATVISLVTDYDHDGYGGWQVGTAYGSISGGFSICEGYSRGFLYLCQKAGLWCVTIDGVAGGNNSHMWNMVRLDTGYYHIDVTWSDELGYPDSAEWLAYFMLTEDEITADHIIDGETIDVYTREYG